MDCDDNDTLISTQEMEDMEKTVEVKATKKATSWGVRKFEDWATKRKISIDLKTCTACELNETLRKFYAELKSNKKNSTFAECSDWCTSSTVSPYSCRTPQPKF